MSAESLRPPAATAGDYEPRGAADSRRFPDFFIVGEPKSGTTALYEMLRRHPQVFMPSLKEPFFFADDLLARDRGRPETTDEYLALFARARPEQRIGEASALYLWSSSAAAQIAAVQPSARIIAIFREPASFLRSLHLQLVQNHTETQKDLRTALALEEDRRHGRRLPRGCRRPVALFYSERVRYVEHLKRYHAAFAAEQVLVLIYDEFRDDNVATLERVLRFLDVDETLPLPVTRANPTVRLRSRQVDSLVNSVSVGRGPISRAAKATIERLVSRDLRRRLLYATNRRLVFGGPPPPDEELMNEVRRRFTGEVRVLGEYLGRDLVGLWGYDQLD